MDAQIATLVAYIAYLAISITLTIWVARTLHRNGRIFLVDAFRGNEPLADSVNHLLVVGFYLINVGYVTLALKYGQKPGSAIEAIEYLSWKVGLVLVVLGVMHFFNMFVFSRMRRRGQEPDAPPPRPAWPPAGPETSPPMSAIPVEGDDNPQTPMQRAKDQARNQT